MGEDERGAGDIADFARAGGDVLEGAPAAGEQDEPAFAQAAQRALKGVAGAGVDVEFPPVGRLFDRDVDAAPPYPGQLAWARPGRQRGRGRAGRGCGQR